MRVLLIVLVALVPTATYAQQRPPAQATAHAIDELHNAIAQGKITVTPTSTPTRAPTAAPTATPQPALTIAGDSPADPSLPFPAPGGNPIGGYLRPSALGDVPLYELALRQGRWDIRAECDSPPQPWSDTWLLVRADGTPVLAGADYFAELDDSLTCPMSAASWHSDTPCAQDADERCEVQMDGGYWDAQAAQEAAQPTPTDVPPVAPVAAAPRPVQRAAAVPAAPPVIIYRDSPTSEPIIVTATPTDTVEPTAAPTKGALATVTPRPTGTPMPTLVLAAAAPSATPAPVVEAASSERSFGFWPLALGGLGVLVWGWAKRRGSEDV